MLIETKDGCTYNGHLVAVDNFMNLKLHDVTLTSRVCGQGWGGQVEHQHC